MAEGICLEELCGPTYAAQIASAVLLEPGCARRLDGIMSILAKEAKAIKFSAITAISMKKYLCSSMLGKRPKLVRIGSAAALAEAPMAAAAEYEAARLADLERKRPSSTRPSLATRSPWAVRWRRRPATLSVRA